jgi:hypothetical protein
MKFVMIKTFIYCKGILHGRHYYIQAVSGYVICDVSMVPAGNREKKKDRGGGGGGSVRRGTDACSGQGRGSNHIYC